MKQISNKEYERYHKYQIDRLYGRILTPDGLRLICAALDYDPEKIGKHMLEMLAKFRNEGIIELNLQDNSKKTGQTVLTGDNMFDKIYLYQSKLEGQ